jgi:hypothetical protein
VRVIYGVHGNTASSRPTDKECEHGLRLENVEDVLVPLSFILVVRPTGFQQWLIDPPTTSHDADRRPRRRRDSLLRTRGEPYPRLALFWLLADDGGVVAGRASKRTAVPNAFLDVADDGALWAG